MAEPTALPPDACPPPLVGRDRELATLRERLAEALAGRGGLVLLAGAAGIGKTALAEALGCEAAVRGALVLAGRCYDLTETPPYGPWLDLLARHRARAAAPPAGPTDRDAGPPAGQAALFAQLGGVLIAAARRQPLVLLLDDLHWADPASLDLLRVVARRLAELPLLLLATYRPEAVARPHPLHALLPALVREARAARLDLQPLGRDDIRALVEARYALPAAASERLVGYLAGRAEGNPFFLEELLRALEEEGVLRRAAPDEPAGAGAGWTLGDLGRARLPPLVRQVLDRRLDYLGEVERGLLAVAAVLGQEVPLDLWAAVALVGEEALLDVVERAVEARVLAATEDGLGVRFAHALVREALYEGLLPPRRRIWHRRVAEALLGKPAPDPDAVAYHFRRAGDPRASEWLLRASARAERAYAWATAAERGEAALALVEAAGADARERAWLRYRLGRLLRYVDPPRGVRHHDAAAALAAASQDRLLTAVLQFDRGSLRAHAGELRAGLAEIEGGVAALDALTAPGDAAGDAPAAPTGDDLPDAVVRQSRLAAWRAIVGRYAEARATCERLVAGWLPPSDPGPVPPPATDPAAVGDVYSGLALAWAALGRPDEARRVHALARAVFAALDDQLMLAREVGRELAYTVVPYFADDPAGWRSLGALAREAHRRLGEAGGDPPPPDEAALLLLLLEGRWAEARALEPAVRTVGIAFWRQLPLSLLGQLAHAQGDADLAWAIVREILPAGPATEPGDSYHLPALALQRLAAALALDGDDLPTARAWLEAHDRWLAWSGATLGRAEGALGWAAYHRAAGDPDLAREHAARALALATEPRQPLALLAAHRLAGELATAAGDSPAAGPHLDQALALAEACAAPYERALTLLALAALRHAEGDRGAAELLLAEARAICEPLGARRALALADALLPGRAPRPPGGYPGGLSAREVEVLTLIAQGRSNREIADMLGLSVRTVDRHVDNLYRKLDVRGRGDAAAFAARHGLLPG